MTSTPRDDLARFLRDDLQGAADGREDVAYEQVEAYVDGTLDDVDREILETRLADDPGLRAMVEDLRALRTALPAAVPAPSRVVPFEPRRWRRAGRRRHRVAGCCRRGSPRRQRWPCSCGGRGCRVPRRRRRSSSRNRHVRPRRPVLRRRR